MTDLPKLNEDDFSFDKNPADIYSEEPEWEDAIIIATITETEDEFKSVDVEIEEWLNRDIVHPSDIEDIEMTLAEYELELGKWKMEIHVHWEKSPDTPNGPGEWDSELHINMLERIDA